MLKLKSPVALKVSPKLSPLFSGYFRIDATVNAILPSVLTPAFGIFMDLRFVGVGDIKIRVMPNIQR